MHRPLKMVDIVEPKPSLDEVMSLAAEGPVLLRRPDGSVFDMSQVDDSDVEAELLKNNADFMAFLRQASREPGSVSLAELRNELGLAE